MASNDVSLSNQVVATPQQNEEPVLLNHPPNNQAHSGDSTLQCVINNFLLKSKTKEKKI